MNRNLTALIITILFITTMAGCIGTDNNSLPAPMEPAIEGEESNYTLSHQFNNFAPMGVGNTTQVVLNETNISIWMDINISAGFHQPIFWEQGSVNFSILDENETVLWSNESSEGQDNFTFIISDNFSHTGNLTLRTLADGSDNATDEQVADWYVIRVKLWCEWEA